MKMSNGLITEMKINSAMRDRRIFLNGVVDEDLSFETCYFLNKIKDLDDKENIPVEKRGKITLVINSYGGSVIWGNAIIGVIENLKSIGYRIDGVVQGFAYSMAFDILICCTHRYAYRLADVMLHQTQTGHYPDDLVALERDVEYTKKQWEKSVDYYVKYTDISREKIQEVYDKRINWYMDVEEAKKYRVIDEIL